MAANSRKSKRQPVAISGMIYDVQGRPMISCVVRNVSISGAQLEFETEADLPPAFTLSLSHEGRVRRLCRSVWQFSTVVGVRFEI
jgi:hypothetical protein